MSEIENTEPTTEDYKTYLLEKQIKKEHYITELEYEWMLFRMAEIEEQVEKWIEIKHKLDKRKNLNDVADCKN